MAEPLNLVTAACPILPAALGCWRAMTKLAIDNRADAIDYLRRVDPPPRLSAQTVAGLLAAFPPLPATRPIGPVSATSYAPSIDRRTRR
jgi:hypothetical protein